VYKLRKALYGLKQAPKDCIGAIDGTHVLARYLNAFNNLSGVGKKNLLKM
jgi:hypothetical protein